MGTSIILDGVPGVLPPGESDKLRTTNNENEVDGKPTTSITAKLLYGVRDSASGFGLLRTIAGTLCSILENTKVYPPFHILIKNTYSHLSKQRWIYKP